MKNKTRFRNAIYKLLESAEATIANGGIVALQKLVSTLSSFSTRNAREIVIVQRQIKEIKEIVLSDAKVASDLWDASHNKVPARLCRWCTRVMILFVKSCQTNGNPLEGLRIHASLHKHLMQCPHCEPYKFGYLVDGVTLLFEAGFYEEGQRQGELVIELVPKCNEMRISLLANLRSELSLGRNHSNAKIINERLLAELVECHSEIPVPELLNQASFAINLSELELALVWLTQYTGRISKTQLDSDEDFYFILGHAVSGLGYVLDAIAHYERSYRIAIGKSATAKAAEAMQNIGGLLNQLGLFDQSIRFHEEAIRLFTLSKLPRKVGATLMNLGVALAAEKKYLEADNAFEKAETLFRETRDIARLGYINLLRADLCLSKTEPDISGATAYLNQLDASLDTNLENTEVEICALGMRSELYIKVGRLEEAITTARQAVALAEVQLEKHAADFTRSFLWSTKFRAPYEYLVECLIAAGHTAEALETHEQSKSAHAPTIEPVFSIADFQRDLSLSSGLSQVLAFSSGPNPAIWRIEDCVLDTMVVNHVESIRKALRDFYTPIERGNIPSDALTAMLSDQLGRTLELAINRASKKPHLFIIPTREWAFIPWALATRENSHVLLKGPLLLGGIFPRASTLQRVLKSSDLAWHRIALVIGDPINSQPPLPGARREAEAITNFLRNSGWAVTSIMGNDATKETFLRCLTDTQPSVIVFATHAEVNHLDARRSRIWLGAETQNSGWLTTGEILENPQIFDSVRLVWMNACETGTPASTQLNSQISLGSSLLSTGADCVVANLWSVFDSAATALAIMCFANLLHGHTIAETIRDAQKSMAGREVTSLDDLEYWAKQRNWEVEAVKKTVDDVGPGQTALRGVGCAFENPLCWAGLQVLGNGLLTLLPARGN